MAVLLSPVGGVAAQFFTNAGVPLSGGKFYTYAAGTSTPQATYTTGAGNIQHSNPIVLDAAGRVTTGEIWLTDGLSYKFVLKDANDVLIATYDNIVGINSNFVNFVNQQEIQTATAGQTVFTLTTMQYQPGTGNLSVFVDGVNQYGPGAQYAYTETSSTVVTFVSGLHVGASVKFTTTEIQNSGVADASQITYTYPGTGAVSQNVEERLAEFVSVKDFGALGDGSGAVVGNSVLTASWNVWPSQINGTTYGTKPGHDYGDATWLAANKPFQPTDTLDFIGIQLAMWTGKDIYLPEGTYVVNRSLRAVCQFYGNIVGAHSQLSIIAMKDRTSFPTLQANGSPVANIGKPVLYFYRTGLSGMTVNTLGIRTDPTGGFDGDANTIESNLATSTSCIAMNNADSVQIRNVFLSGTGEMGINLYDQCAIGIDNLTTEYFSAHIFMQAGCFFTITNSNIYNSWKNTDTAKRVAGILMYGPNASVKCYTTNFWEMYYGAVYSKSNSNSLVFHENTVTNAYSVAAGTDGTGYLLYLSQFSSGTSGIGSFDVQNNSFLFGNNGYAPLVLIPTYPSVFSNNNVSTAGTQVTWGAMQLIGSNVSLCNNTFDVTQVVSPSAGGNVIFGSASAPYANGTSKILFANNNIYNQQISKYAINGIVSNNVGNSTIGSINLSSGITSGTYYTLIAAGQLTNGTYLIDIEIQTATNPYAVSASGVACVNTTQSATQGNGPAIPLAVIDYLNTGSSLTVKPLPGTGISCGFQWSANYSYVGMDGVLYYKIVRIA